MQAKDILILIGGLGSIWAIIQYFINRKNLKKDRKIEKRFDVYSSFMNKIDEMSVNLRSDPQMIYGITNEAFSTIINGDEEQGNRALIEMNENLTNMIRKSTQSIMVINQEFNKVQLVCSEKLLPKLTEYKILVNDFIDEIQNILNTLSGNTDINLTTKAFQSIGHPDRTKRFKELNEEVIIQMREELGLYNK